MSVATQNTPGPSDRIAITLLFAAALHALVILGIGFEFEQPDEAPRRLLDVEIITITNPQPKKEVEKADFLAQTSQEGGGNKDKALRPTAPAKAPNVETANTPTPRARKSTPKAAAPKPVQKPPKKVVVKRSVAPKPPPPPPAPTVVEEAKPKPTRAQLYNSLQKEIERQSAELDRLTQAYAKRPRRKIINARTKEYRFANYLDAWRRKVERIGNLNYPEEAKRQKIYGTLLLRVSIKSDGSVHKIVVMKSSGSTVLDDAAKRIVTLAAPYQKFPENIRSEYDILDIIRTWQFLNTDRFRSK